MKRDVLFITEKWCDGNPETGLTNNYHNLFNTMRLSGLATDVSILHYDELFYNHKIHIDGALPQYFEESKPDVVVSSHWGTSPLNPSPKSYDLMKNLGIKTIIIWPDTRDWAIDAILNLSQVNLHVSGGGEVESPLAPNHMWIPPSQDETLYYDDTKTTNVSFIGSIEGYGGVRKHYINYLKEHGVDVVSAGGQREQKLSPEEYARLVRVSKMGINFGHSAKLGTFQSKGRITEILASNSLLLEFKCGMAQRQLKLVPGKDFIEFDSPEDLKDKIEYFTKNENERKEIARNGYNVYNENYTSFHYWNNMFQKINI
jgi:glycosyltransferase involved in cell wall biosynthesis